MSFYFVQATIFPTSNLAADASTNTFSFEAASLPAVSLGILPSLEIFYKSLVSIFPNTVRQDVHTLKAYDRADPEPRQPVFTRTFDFTAAPGGAPLPPEVALCLSFQGEPVSGEPQARKRGRIYLGPIRQDRVGTDGRPTQGMLTSVLDAATALKAAGDASTTWYWAVWSPTTAAASTPALANVPIENGWVDNEFDTQRRRGRVATFRQTFS